MLPDISFIRYRIIVISDFVVWYVVVEPCPTVPPAVVDLVSARGHVADDSDFVFLKNLRMGIL